VQLRVDGCAVDCEPADHSLLTVLREQLGLTSVKDGCSPQGQCGCCTVLVDGAPRVSCVTPARRMAGRDVTTVDGLDPAVRDRLVSAFVDAGASQCGFCTPGILVRLAGLGPDPHPNRVDTALLAHLCRCTGWNTVVEAATGALAPPGPRDLAAAAARATLEGGGPQRVGPDVVLGRGGFAADTAPEGDDMVTAVPDGAGGWALGASLGQARARVRTVPGRRSGRVVGHPVAVPDGQWALTLQTTWVEPAYLEPDVSWCVPGGVPASAVANGGAFGAKSTSPAPAAAAALAAREGRPVRVVLSREDVVRTGPKRPPMGAGIRADGTGIIRMARTPGVAGAVHAVAPGLVVEEVDVTGPPTSSTIRTAGWAEAAVLLAAVARLGAPAGAAGAAASAAGARADAAGASTGDWSGPPVEVRAPGGALAWAEVDVDGSGAPSAVRVRLACGDPLDAVVLRSYAIGAAHMALGWVCSEAVALDPDGVPVDLTIRSFGVLRARDMPEVTVEIAPSTDPAVNGSDAVFAAVAAATWVAQGLVPTWPTRRGSTR
jgi:xanthine dehydrogenase small subunit